MKATPSPKPMTSTPTPTPAVTPTVNLTLTLLLLTLTLLLQLSAHHAQGMRHGCNPQTSKNSCMRGCLSCWKTYGGELYDVASCCRECSYSGASLVDIAPNRCSLRHVQKTWLKRFG